MIVYESTANGTGNFFQIEYDAAKKGESQFEAMFVSWFDIEQYSLEFDSEEENISSLFGSTRTEKTTMPTLIVRSPAAIFIGFGIKAQPSKL